MSVGEQRLLTVTIKWPWPNRHLLCNRVPSQLLQSTLMCTVYRQIPTRAAVHNADTLQRYAVDPLHTPDPLLHPVCGHRRWLFNFSTCKSSVFTKRKPYSMPLSSACFARSCFKGSTITEVAEGYRKQVAKEAMIKYRVWKAHSGCWCVCVWSVCGAEYFFPLQARAK